MKLKCNLLFLLAGVLFQSCSYTDPTTAISIQVDVEIEAMNSIPLPAGVSWTDSKVIDLNSEFSERYGIDLDENKLTSLRLLELSAGIDSETCQSLSELSTSFNLPNIQPISFSDSGNGLQAVCAQPNYIQVSDQPGQMHPALDTDFAEAIVGGSSFTIDYSVTVDEQVDSTQSITFKVIATAEFVPNN